MAQIRFKGEVVQSCTLINWNVGYRSFLKGYPYCQFAQDLIDKGILTMNAGFDEQEYADHLAWAR